MVARRGGIILFGKGFLNTLKVICDDLVVAQESVQNKIRLVYDDSTDEQVMLYVSDRPLNHRIEFVGLPDRRVMVRGRRYMAVFYGEKEMRLAVQPLKAVVLPAPHKIPNTTLKEIITDYYLSVIQDWYIHDSNQSIIFNLNKQRAINQQKNKAAATLLEQNQWEYDLFQHFAEPREKINASQ